MKRITSGDVIDALARGDLRADDESRLLYWIIECLITNHRTSGTLAADLNDMADGPRGHSLRKIREALEA
jgi:hypothetical protein